MVNRGGIESKNNVNLTAQLFDDIDCRMHPRPGHIGNGAAFEVRGPNA